MPQTPPPSKREQLIHTALTLFSRYGFHATGIDLIAKESGVTKRTLYAHFGSKDELVVATLRHLDEQLRSYFLKHTNSTCEDPKQRLLSVFDAAGFWFSEDNFFGCTFINAIGEYAESNDSIRQVCSEYKRLSREWIKGLCEQAGAPNPQQLSDELSLILEGAIVTAQVSPQLDAAAIAKRAATALVEQALKDA
ncbi:Transcriptional regulator2C TetR family [gamma proteobacterium IMCC2047]|nr:Transcriptional regulator2C TetR family [gamma proteobacterium IMCC2047]